LPLIGGVKFVMQFTRTRSFVACPGGRCGRKICRPQAELSGGGTRSHSSPLVGRGEKDRRTGVQRSEREGHLSLGRGRGRSTRRRRSNRPGNSQVKRTASEI
jgi:hypothetical protein